MKISKEVLRSRRMGEFEMLQTEMHELSESVTDYWFLSPEAIEDARYVKSRINPDLPTIALCTSNVNSAELLTLPQVQPDEPRANVLMLTLSDLCEIFVDDGVTYARSGFVLDDTGAIRHGYFDEPLRIDSIEERQLAAHTSRELNESGCTVYNPSDLSELMRSKDATKHIYEGLLPFAPGIVVHDNTASSMDSIYDFIELEGAHSRIVIKPSRGIQGVDVSIMLCTDTESILQEVQRLLGQNQSVIIERFIEPFPITEDGEELDVTLRTVSVGCIDEHALEHMMVARPAKKGQPVTVDENEHYYTSQWLFNKANKQGIDTKSIRDQIASIHSVIRQSGLETFACDMIIDKNGKVWLIEINTGPIGALDMICMAVESADDRLELLRKIASYMKPPEVKKGSLATLDIGTGDYQNIILAAKECEISSYESHDFLRKALENIFETTISSQDSGGLVIDLVQYIKTLKKDDPDAYERASFIARFAQNIMPVLNDKDKMYLLNYLAIFDHYICYPDLEQIIRSSYPDETKKIQWLCILYWQSNDAKKFLEYYCEVAENLEDATVKGFLEGIFYHFCCDFFGEEFVSLPDGGLDVEALQDVYAAARLVTSTCSIKDVINNINMLPAGKERQTAICFARNFHRDTAHVVQRIKLSRLERSERVVNS